MVRVQRSPGAVTLVSRLARPHALAVLAAVFLGGAAAAARALPALALALAAAALALAVLGGRSVRARFERGRVSVRHPVPLRRQERALGEFAGAAVETAGDARRRRADRLARGFAARAGSEMPAWLRAPDAPGTHDHLRRVVLVARRGEDLPVTSWLADRDLEAVRAEVEALLPR
ncbi:MAG TPA: hypothetical protein VFL83_20115 [Anaeromyxobacter sp.]|nr:hypothetical protein [Anaeromyxobacter sp.]